VIDTGIGIAPDKQAEIFQAFTQVDGSSTRRYGGTGLGLTISAQLVSLMGGDLWVESKPGRGSAFQFRLTLPLSHTTVAPQILPHAGELAGLTAVVIDDNETSLRIVSGLLRSWGMTVVEGRSAEGARRAVESAGHAFSLAVVDMHMPGVDGVDVARALRRHPQTAAAALIVLTSSDRADERRGAESIVDIHFVMKPVAQSVLLEGVRAALGRRTSADAQTAAPAATPMRAAHRLRVLVAEDNAVNRKLAEHLLRRRGHRPLMVTNGRDAVEVLATEQIDLVLMDLQMPEMDGFEATAAIRELERGTGRRLPIIALTAHAMEGDRQRCLGADMDGYLSKPIKAVELFEVIDRVMAATSPSPVAGSR
jgi:CheY-like chemotaxis protein